MIKSIYTLTILVLLSTFMLTGCSRVVFRSPSGVEATYIRWFDQEITGLTFTTPDGWILKLDHQKSELEVAFQLGALSITKGNK